MPLTLYNIVRSGSWSLQLNNLGLVYNNFRSDFKQADLPRNIDVNKTEAYNQLFKNIMVVIYIIIYIKIKTYYSLKVFMRLYI